MRIFEPFTIVNFEQLRNNTLQDAEQIKTKRSKRKIFQDVESPKQFRANVMEYKQFLDVSGLGG